LAYTQLVRRHYQPVFLVCLGVLGNVHDAEDAAQDALLKGLERIRQLREPAQFGGWIVAIARNLSINLLRKRKQARHAPHTGNRRWAQEVVCHVRPAVGQMSSGDERIESGREDLQRAVARLPMDLRLPLVMYYFDGRDVKSVAAKLAISPSGVYQKLRTAIQELQEILTAQGDTR
jgi:RNA polymerase sigma-70 factor, ECF subfamily